MLHRVADVAFLLCPHSGIELASAPAVAASFLLSESFSPKQSHGNMNLLS
jgi:hypothetical protein